MRPRTALTTTLAAVALAVTSCSSSSHHTPAEPHTTPAPAAPTPSIDRDTLTRATFTIAWNQTAPDQQDAYCTAVDTLGPRQAAEALRAGAGGGDELDWPLMGQLLADECANR